LDPVFERNTAARRSDSSSTANSTNDIAAHRAVSANSPEIFYERISSSTRTGRRIVSCGSVGEITFSRPPESNAPANANPVDSATRNDLTDAAYLIIVFYRRIGTEPKCIPTIDLSRRARVKLNVHRWTRRSRHNRAATIL